MKKYRLYVEPNKMRFSSELVLLGGLLKDEPQDSILAQNYKGETRYKNIRKVADSLFMYTDKIKEADAVVLPYKLKGTYDPYLIKIMRLASQFNLKTYAFYNDDDEKVYNLPSRLTLFRTSISKNSNMVNEFALPAFVPDFFENDYLLQNCYTCGFCGKTNNIRERVLNNLSKSDLDTDFIQRNGFWAPEILNKMEARRDFINNIRNNTLTLCVRGEGNFSYRFFEVLMMARIPLLINTGTKIPFYENIKDHLCFIEIEEKDLPNICWKKLKHSFLRKSIHERYLLLKGNREIWKSYFTPTGFLQQFYNFLKNDT
ncbi:MAG: hypothetical protein ACO3PR_02760 [Limisphaerales bacterium]